MAANRPASLRKQLARALDAGDRATTVTRLREQFDRLPLAFDLLAHNAARLAQTLYDDAHTPADRDRYASIKYTIDTLDQTISQQLQLLGRVLRHWPIPAPPTPPPLYWPKIGRDRTRATTRGKRKR